MDQQILVFYANDSRKYEHLYLRGNFQTDMFFDKVDMINVWNRIWLSARATGVQILSVAILNNHFHITVIIASDEQRTRFVRHLRLSITQYHNRRYKVHGTLGTRTLKHAQLKDLDDIKDCICYHIRNVLHHGISKDFLNYPFSTCKFVFNLSESKQKGIYTRETLPHNLEAYLPAREKLPEGWYTTIEGIIMPPPEIFRADMIEVLFESREDYLKQLTYTTKREASNAETPESTIRIYANDSRKIQDEMVVEFVKANCQIPIPSMNTNQKMVAIRKILDEIPKVNQKLLSRIFGIPYTTIKYRINTWRK